VEPPESPIPNSGIPPRRRNMILASDLVTGTLDVVGTFAGRSPSVNNTEHASLPSEHKEISLEPNPAAREEVAENGKVRTGCGMGNSGVAWPVHDALAVTPS
jgi:hypothetical protein